jgi:hypothetical protein
MLVTLTLLAIFSSTTVIRADSNSARIKMNKSQWETGRILELDGLKVVLSKPVLVCRSKNFLWFPTLGKLSNGDIVAVMSLTADDFFSTTISAACRSSNGGLTWSEPRVLADGGEVFFQMESGDTMLVPYLLRPKEGGIGAPYNIFAPGGLENIKYVKSGITVSGLPKPYKCIPPGVSSFVFNGQIIQLKSGKYLGTLYGTFENDTQYSLLAAETSDGINWTIFSIIADYRCGIPMEGCEGPCESAVCRLPDGRIMCIFRIASGRPYGQTWSDDEGKTWAKPVEMKGVFSVQPSIVVLEKQVVAISGGRPGIFLWLNSDGKATNWTRIDILSHHNACVPEEPIVHSSCYTEIVPLDGNRLLYIYDNLPNGWHPIPDASDKTNSVWVVCVTVEKTR